MAYGIWQMAYGLRLTVDGRKSEWREAVTADRVNHRVRRSTQAKPQGAQHPGRRFGPEHIGEV